MTRERILSFLQEVAELAYGAFQNGRVIYPKVLKMTIILHLLGVGFMFLCAWAGVSAQAAILGYVLVGLISGSLAALIAQAHAQDVFVPSSLIKVFSNGLFWKYVLASILPILVVIFCAMGAYTFVAFAMIALGWTATWGLIFPLSAAVITGAVLYARLFLVMPAMAVGEPLSLSRSWRDTKGHVMQILAGLVIVSLPLMLLQAAIAFLPDTYLVLQIVGLLLMIMVVVAQYVLHGSLGGVLRKSLAR